MTYEDMLLTFVNDIVFVVRVICDLRVRLQPTCEL